MSSRMPGTVRILGILTAEEDRESLRELSRAFGWTALLIHNGRDLSVAFQQFQPHVVITDWMLAGGEGWKDVLHTAQDQPESPPVIVSSRLADERLWAEVLNLGGYDLLLRPLVASEVHNVVSMARRSQENKWERAHRGRMASAS
jgi:DNA-binding response OmpR family regulator